MKPIKVFDWALADPSIVRDALGLTRTNDDQEALVASVVNAATSDLEAFCGRRLRSRAYVIGNMKTPPMRIRGDGSIRIIVPEYPLTAVTAIRWRDRSAVTWNNLDITALDFQHNWIETPAEAVPFGNMAEITCEAGYKAGYDSWHDASLSVLESQCLRLITIKWQDLEKKTGRKLIAATVRGDQVFGSTDLPDDMKYALYPYRKIA